MNITINTTNLRNELIPLYEKYSGQLSEQPAYIEMDEDGNVCADYSGEIGNAEPMSVWNGRTRQWGVDSSANGDSLADLLESDKVKSLLERVYQGHDVHWDGSNHVGRLNDDAEEASNALDEIFSPASGEYSVMEVWGAQDWISAGFFLDALIKAGSVEDYASDVTDELYNNCSTAAIYGDMEDAVALIAAEIIRRPSHDSDQTPFWAAKILVEYDKYKYSSLLDHCREDLGIYPVTLINDKGREEIRQWIVDLFQPEDGFISEEQLDAYVEDAERSLGEGNGPSIEVLNFASPTGRTELFRVSDDGVGAYEADEAGERLEDPRRATSTVSITP